MIFIYLDRYLLTYAKIAINIFVTFFAFLMWKKKYVNPSFTHMLALFFVSMYVGGMWRSFFSGDRFFIEQFHLRVSQFYDSISRAIIYTENGLR